MKRKDLGLLLAAVLVFVGAGAAMAQTEPSMLYVGTLHDGLPQLDGGEYYAVHEYEALPGETIFAYLHSQEFDAFIGLLDPAGNVIARADDSAGVGTDAWIVTTLEGGIHTFVVTSAFRGEVGAWQLFVASGVARPGEFVGSLESGELVVRGGLPAAVHLVEGQEGETIELSVDSSEFDAVLLVAAPDGDFATSDDDVGTNPRLSYTFPADGIYPVIVSSYDGRTGAYTAAFVTAGGTAGPGTGGKPGTLGGTTDDNDAASDQNGAASDETGDGDANDGDYPLVGNTWIYQTMTYPDGAGGHSNEYISGHLTMYPGGTYEMVVNIGQFTNRYQGGYSIAGDVITFDNYGTARFAKSGTRLTLWDGAGSIYGLALEGSCDEGGCATR